MLKTARAALCLCTGLVLAISLCGFRPASAPEAKLVNTQEFAAGNLLGVEAHYAADKLILLESDSDKIVLKEYVSHPIPGCNATISYAERILTIRGGKRPQNVESRAYIELYVPSDFSGSIALNTASGTIQSENTGFHGAVSLSSASGKLYLSGVSFDLACSTASGTIQVQGDALRGMLSTASGDVSVKADVLSGDLDIMSASGDIGVELSSSASFHLNASTSSGRISNGFQAPINARGQTMTFGPNPVHGVDLRTASGNIDIGRR